MRIMGFTPYGPRLEPETVNAIMALGAHAWLFQADNPHGPGRDSILHQYQQGRKAFLASDYDALLVIESDIIPPHDTIERLTALDADVAYGVYLYRTSNVINVYEKYPEPSRNMGQSLSLHPHKLRAAYARQVVPMTGGGLGCCLIHRHVLQALDFRMEATAHCDTWFSVDLALKGYRQMADMRVLCGHKTEDGHTLWPMPGGDL